MPWFITSLCSDETIRKVWGGTCGVSGERPQRTFGFFDRYHEAFLTIKDNVGNMQESLYDLIVLEYIEPGIHPKVYSDEWYRWDYEKSKWVHTVRPPEFQNVTNFALG